MASTFEAMSFAISSPPFLGMLDSYRSCMSKPQFKHLVTFVAGLMLSGRWGKNVMDIASNALDGRSQSSVNRFLHSQAGRRRWSGNASTSTLAAVREAFRFSTIR